MRISLLMYNRCQFINLLCFLSCLTVRPQNVLQLSLEIHTEDAKSTMAFSNQHASWTMNNWHLVTTSRKNEIVPLLSCCLHAKGELVGWVLLKLRTKVFILNVFNNSSFINTSNSGFPVPPNFLLYFGWVAPIIMSPSWVVWIIWIFAPEFFICITSRLLYWKSKLFPAANNPAPQQFVRNRYKYDTF